MQIKNIYILLMLCMVIIISQTFAVILALPVLREGVVSDCLPSCKDVNYDYDNSSIPPCKALNIQLLTQEDAKKYGLPIITNFTNNINNYINTNYKFDTIKTIQNNNIKIYTGENIKDNEEQIIINKYFTDFSGIYYPTNQDILDNIVKDPNFNTTLTKFQYSLDKDNPDTVTKTNILDSINKYNQDMSNPPNDLVEIYKKFLKDISDMCDTIDKNCPNDYTESNLLTIIKNETKKPKYFSTSSSFNIVSGYISKTIKGTLTS